MDNKCVFMRYLIGPGNLHSGPTGPLTTSCEAYTRIVSKRRVDRVVGGSSDTVSGTTQLFLLYVVTDLIRMFTFHWECAHVRVILSVSNQYYLHKMLKRIRRLYVHCNLDYSISSRDYQNWPKLTYG